MNKEVIDILKKGLKEAIDEDCTIKIKIEGCKVLLDYINQLEENYKNELEENFKLSELWCKSQEQKRQLETNRDEVIEVLKLCNSQCSKETISILERGKE